MPRAKKTWREKMVTQPAHHVILDKSFAGVPQGARLLISCPQEIAAELQTLAPGTTLSIQAFRQRLANKHACDAACPVSTSLFLRIVAEYTWEEYQHSGSLQNLPPFWRVLDPASPLARKLSFDPAWIALQRELEAR